MTRKHTSLAVAVAAMLAVAGCGSSGDADGSASFIQQYNKAQAPLRGLVTRLEADAGRNAADAGRFARDLRATADELDSVRANLAKLEAPSDAQDEVTVYLSELESGADEIRRFARVVKRGEPQRLAKAVGTFQTALTDVSRAEVSLSEAVR